MTKINESNIDFKERLIKLENDNAKEDSTRRMVWYALFGMLLYPFGIIICDYYGLERSIKELSNIAEIYFLSVSGLISVYFGANAYTNKFKKD